MLVASAGTAVCLETGSASATVLSVAEEDLEKEEEGSVCACLQLGELDTPICGSTYRRVGGKECRLDTDTLLRREAWSCCN